MFEDFIEVSPAVFYGTIWPRIARRVTVTPGNFAQPADECFPPWLLVRWCEKTDDRGVYLELAISVSDGEGPDRHWVHPSVLHAD